MINYLKNKTFEEVFGNKKAKQMKINLSKTLKKRWKGKNLEEMFGVDKVKEIKEKNRKRTLGKTYEQI